MDRDPIKGKKEDKVKVKTPTSLVDTGAVCPYGYESTPAPTVLGILVDLLPPSRFRLRLRERLRIS